MPAVLTERRAAVLVITIDRPEARNAVNRAVAEGIAAALDELDGDDALAVGVLTGAAAASAPAWTSRPSSRASRPTSRGAASPASSSAGRASRSSRRSRASRSPAGFEIALACDLIVAARGARLGIPEVKRSLVAAAGALRRLPRRMPYGLAMELALTGDPIDAERAHALGVVNRLAEPGGAVEAALELAAAIARNGPLAVAATKEVLERQWEWGEEEFWARQLEVTAPVFGSADAREGAVAFAEKREPVWRGR